MSGAKRLNDTALKLALVLLVAALLLSFLRQWALGGRVVASDQPTNAQLPWFATLVGRGCAILFAIGFLVRLKRWFSARAAESARKRRLEAGYSLVGSPERVDAERSSRLGSQRLGRRR
jgi:hypothetical protein